MCLTGLPTDPDVAYSCLDTQLGGMTMPVFEVQRYFFGVRWSDHEDDDPSGAVFSDNAAALNYADRLIRELKEGGRYDDPNLMVIVGDEMKTVVLSIPFLAACA
jgi:hypothetical protein